MSEALKYYSGESPFFREATLMIERYAELVKSYASPNDAFVELGIGHGHTVRLLKGYFRHLTVVDWDAHLIARNSIESPHVEFVQGSFESYRPQKALRGVGMGFVLDLVDDPCSILTRFSSFLESGGRLYASV